MPPPPAPPTASASESNYLLHDSLLMEKELMAKRFRLAMLSVYDRSNFLWIKSGINANRLKFGAISSFYNTYILTPPLANQLFSFALQLRKTKLWNRPTGMKSIEIIRDVKKSIVCDSGEMISTVQEVFSLTVETDRSPSSYTIHGEKNTLTFSTHI